MRWLFFTLIICLISVKGSGQSNIAQKIAFNHLANPTTNLFVHFDKNIYSNNETVYFTAYILKTEKFHLNAHKILAVALVRDVDSALIKSDKFLIQNGLAFGNMLIPDSVVTGNYQLLAYTDKLVNGKPELIFKQPITIKTNIELPFRANIKLVENPSISNKENQVLISVTTNDYKFLSKPVSVNYKYGTVQKTAKTDAAGQLLLNIPKQQNLVDPNISVKLKYQKDSSFLSMPLPTGKITANVKFFPEGGNLVTNIISTVAWEVTDLQKRPIALKAFLLKNNSPIDTIETNSYGIGKFKLLADENAVYTVKLANNSLADTVYKLPKVLSSGLVINIENAVVEDTLSLILRNHKSQKFFIRIHNFKQCFLDIPFDMEMKIRKLKISLAEIPKGLNTITITDSLDRPLAERLFFAHYNNKDLIYANTDKNTYHQREQVSLTLNSKDLPETAIVSIAVVQENRLTLRDSNDIKSYTYIRNQLENMPSNGKTSIYKDRDYLEQILSVKGWRRYTWQQTQDIKPSDTLKKIDSLQITGIVKKNKKPLTAAVNLATFGDSNIRVIETSMEGKFDFSTPDLITEYGKKMHLFVNATNKASYNIEINDAFEKASKDLSKTEASLIPTVPLNLTNNSDLVLKNNEKAIQLKEVTIKKTVDRPRFHYAKGGFGANSCGDYVCMYDILNCTNHANDPGNSQPIAGVTYKGSNGPYQECKTYTEEDKSFVAFSGIRYHKEFYLHDYKDPLEPAFFSTIYWNYGTILQPKKETTLTFYTSDITGMFKVIMQGITKNDVIYTEQKFEVKQKGQVN
ncbi:MG2 domain protein [compost metagenome]